MNGKANLRFRPQGTRLRTERRLRTGMGCGLWAVAIGVLFAGCAQERCGETATPAQTRQVCTELADKAEVMQAAEDVLVKMGFSIGKADARAGLIRTRPLSGAQFFEFWRGDSVGAFNTAEANLHSIRRTVQLEITEQGRRLCIACRARTERLSLPDQQADSLFSASATSLRKMQQRSGIGWIDLGDDTRLSGKILERIERRISELREED